MLTVLFVCACMLLVSMGAPITSLPGFQGFDQLSFSMDSGYITVNQTGGRHLFYWFAASQSNPDTDPLVFWFTGGPGCSGLDALISENGPFRLDDNGVPIVNGWSWNRQANMVWLEQPAGVGYSVNEKSNYASDTQSAADNYVFVQKFVEKFPEFQNREIWLVGESYGGMYVPTLVQTILKGPNQALINQLTGFMLGNPVMMCSTASVYYQVSPFQFNKFFYSGTISWTTYAAWTKHNCDAVTQHDSAAPKRQKKICKAIYNQGLKNIGDIEQQLGNPYGADLDTDNLFQYFCTGNATLDRSFQDESTCVPLESKIHSFFNTPSVRQALHANSSATWVTCTNALDYHSDLESTGLIPVLEDIFKLKPSLKILYYSGDVDVDTVPTQNTQACLGQLYDVVSNVKPWKPWRINGWHAGYVEEFDRYSFATIKGAGHEAPQYQPATAFNLFSRFLQNQSLDEPEIVKSGERLRYKSQGQALKEQLGKILNSAEQ